ncbi:MAG TPA: cytochrome c oxidase subunit II [Bryobacteraceae bacterium]|jgi:cytochrome c oxidase subunit 2
MVPWLRPHSPQAQAIVSLFGQYLVVAAVIFAVVTALVVYTIIRYRERLGASEPPQYHGSRAAEITWTAIPLLIVLVLFVLTVRTMAFVDAPQDPIRAPDVVITGQQWWWLAQYPGGAATASEIHIPVGRRLLARVDAADVIHDFWAPQLGRKIDAIPGRAGYVWLEADAPGVYQGTCSEFCGMQHAGMHFQVIAEPEGDFNVWLERQAAPPVPPEGVAAQGERLFRERKCGDCHAVSLSDTRALIGPPLTHVASRMQLGGDRANTPENMALWVNEPQSIKPGNRMPDQHLAASEVQALTAYMESLR